MTFSSMLAVLALVSLCTVSSVDGKASVPITFGVIGDWGWGADGDYGFLSAAKLAFAPIYNQAQIAVGEALGVKCASANCKFVINTGDNFYNLGIDKNLGVLDSQFRTSFHNVYSNPSLQIPFYGVLGNHDYGRASTTKNHSILPQLEYTFYDESGQWYLPSRFYSVSPTITGSTMKIQLTMVDSSPFLDNYCTVPSGTYYTSELLYGCQTNARLAVSTFAKKKLTAARANKAWNIMVGHHPLISSGDGAYEPYNTIFSGIIKDKTTMPQLWFNGHDHILAHYRHPNNTRTNSFTVGSSGIFASSDLPTPANPFFSMYQFLASANSFGIVTLYDTYADVGLYGVNVSDPTYPSTLLYSARVNK